MQFVFSFFAFSVAFFVSMVLPMAVNAASGEVLPKITKIEISTPTIAGSVFSIFGENFAPSNALSKNSVSFSGATSTTILGGRTDLLIVRLPQTVRSGDVVVSVDGKNSAPFLFSLPNPEILAIGSNNGFQVGSLATIATRNMVFYGADAAGTRVLWNDKPVGIEKLDAPKGEVSILLPEMAGDGNLIIESNGLKSVGVKVSVLPKPVRLLSLSSAGAGSRLFFVSGSGFSADAKQNSVMINDSSISAEKMIDSQTAQFSFPSGIANGVIKVKNGNALPFSSPRPSLSSLGNLSRNGRKSIGFVVSGSNFSSTGSENLLFLGGASIAPSTSKPNELFFSTSSMPPLFGEAWVETNGIKSNKIEYDFRSELMPRIFSISCSGGCYPGAVANIVGQNLLSFSTDFPAVSISVGKTWEPNGWSAFGGNVKLPIDAKSNAFLTVSITSNGIKSNEIGIQLGETTTVKATPTLLSFSFPDGPIFQKTIVIDAFSGLSGEISEVSFSGVTVPVIKQAASSLRYIATIPFNAPLTGKISVRGPLSAESNELSYTLFSEVQPFSLGLRSASGGSAVADGSGTTPLSLRFASSHTDLVVQKIVLGVSCDGDAVSCDDALWALGGFRVMKNGGAVLSGARSPVEKTISLFGGKMEMTATGGDLLPIEFSVAPSISRPVTLRFSILSTEFENGITHRALFPIIEKNSVSVAVWPLVSRSVCQSVLLSGTEFCSVFLGKVKPKIASIPTVASSNISGSVAEEGAAWYAEPMAWGVTSGLVASGVSFDRTVTRAEFLDRLQKVLKTASSSDSRCIGSNGSRCGSSVTVAPRCAESTHHPLGSTLETAAKSSWIASGNCAPDRTVNRAEGAAILVRAFGKAESVQDAAVFEDLQNHWAAGVFGAAKKAGILDGTDAAHASPAGILNWAQTLKLLKKAQESWGTAK